MLVDTNCYSLETVQQLEDLYKARHGSTYTVLKARQIGYDYYVALATCVASNTALTDEVLGLTFPTGAEQ